MAFDLADADFAGELGGGRAVSLQREGTVQGLLVAAPHLGEGEFLRRHGEEEGDEAHGTVILMRALFSSCSSCGVTLSHAKAFA